MRSCCSKDEILQCQTVSSMNASGRIVIGKGIVWKVCSIGEADWILRKEF